jgi:y4mF family transcriptional regulator
MESKKKVPIGTIVSVTDLGRLVVLRRKSQGLTQTDVASLGQIGSRFIGELERGKDTLQLGKVLHVLDLLGLDMVIVERGS